MTPTPEQAIAYVAAYLAKHAEESGYKVTEITCDGIDLREPGCLRVFAIVKWDCSNTEEEVQDWSVGFQPDGVTLYGEC